MSDKSRVVEAVEICLGKMRIIREGHNPIGKDRCADAKFYSRAAYHNMAYLAQCTEALAEKIYKENLGIDLFLGRADSPFCAMVASEISRLGGHDERKRIRVGLLKKTEKFVGPASRVSLVKDGQPLEIDLLEEVWIKKDYDLIRGTDRRRILLVDEVLFPNSQLRWVASQLKGLDCTLVGAAGLYNFGPVSPKDFEVPAIFVLKEQRQQVWRPKDCPYCQNKQG